MNQAGQRRGSIATYLEPWHGDVFEFYASRLQINREEKSGSSKLEEDLIENKMGQSNKSKILDFQDFNNQADFN